ncbi:MAG: hypothetical protein ABIF77_10070 [bacterium]
MKLLTCLVCLSILLFSCPLFAQIDPDDDGVGIYFDLAGDEHCSQVPMGIVRDLYLLLTNASAPGGVAGWECRIENYPEYNFIVNWQPIGWIGSILDPPNFQIGLATPLPWAPAIHLMTITVLVINMDCWWFSIVPHPLPTVPGEIVYADGDDLFNFIPMHQSTGGPDTPVAGINCSCPPPIDTESISWGGVKSMYK